MDLSGSVLGFDRKPVAGVQVRLVGENAEATTDALGEWRIQAMSTRIVPGVPRRAEAQRTIVVENGKLRVNIAGRDPAGRGAGVESLLAGANNLAGKVQGVADTLTYSLGGKVLLRDTISSSRSGIVRILDSTFNPAIVYGYLTDSRDGRTYRTVKIGNQVWMAENLDLEPDEPWRYNDPDKSWWYNDNPEIGGRYGRLYTWASVLSLADSCNKKVCGRRIQARHRGICPEGWHIPDVAEWMELVSTTGGSAAGSGLKSVVGWRDSGNGTDTYGFRGLPGGHGYEESAYDWIGERGYWWSVSEDGETFGKSRILDGEEAYLMNGGTPKDYGLSVRCIQDGPQVLEPVVTREGMTLIPAGTFAMGSPVTEANRFGSETQHSVTLSAFWMDTTLVTQGQYAAVMGVNPSYYVRCGTDCPVEEVTWFDAVLYCNARSKRDGLDTVYTYASMVGTYGDGVSTLEGIKSDLSRNGYRLPTEAQWEYAARGGTKTAYYWGESADADTVNKYAWHMGNSVGITRPVATKPGNPFGLYDMAGNACEWTNDWYGTYASIEQFDPGGPLSGSGRVVRGGSWVNPASYLRSARRGSQRPAERIIDNGFRAVRPAP